MRELETSPPSPRLLLETLAQSQKRPFIVLMLQSGQTLEGQFLAHHQGTLSLATRDGIWFVEVSAVVGVRVAASDLQMTRVEPLTRLALARLIQAETPPGVTMQVDEELLEGHSDFGWLRPWIQELVETIRDISSDSLGVAALQEIACFVLVRGESGALRRTSQRLEIAADPEGPRDLKSKILARL